MQRAKNTIFREKMKDVQEIIDSSISQEEKFSRLHSTRFTLRMLKQIFISLYPNKTIERAGKDLYIRKFKRGILNKDYLVRSYLDMPYKIDISNDWVGNEENLSKFPLILKNIDLGIIPSNLSEIMYSSFYKNELIDWLKNRERKDQNNVDYLENRRPNIKNIKKFYSFMNKGKNLPRDINIHDAQIAIGIKTPILFGFAKDIIIADRMINENIKPYVYDYYSVKVSCKKLNIPEFPDNIKDLKKMDERGEIEIYNNWAQFYRDYIKQRASRIPIKTPNGNYTKIGICRKLKYLSKNKNELPKDASWNQDLKTLLTYLRILENS